MAKSTSTISRIQAEDIINWFSEPQIHFLGIEEAIAYVLHSLLTRDSYGTELINNLGGKNRISDTVLYEAFGFLISQEMVTVQAKRVDGRGRPRHIYSIDLNSPKLAQAKEIAECWVKHLAVG